VVNSAAEPDGETEADSATCTIPEAAMHTTISYEMNRARIAELHDQAQRDRLARAARRARRPRRHQLSDHLAMFPVLVARRLLTATGTRAP
jgi:hypothetical protein